MVLLVEDGFQAASGRQLDADLQHRCRRSQEFHCLQKGRVP